MLLKQGDAAGLRKHQIRPLHVFIDFFGKAHHLDVPKAALQLFEQLAVVTRYDGGAHPR